jgi:hypothetical protein
MPAPLKAKSPARRHDGDETTSKPVFHTVTMILPNWPLLSR